MCVFVFSVFFFPLPDFRGQTPSLVTESDASRQRWVSNPAKAVNNPEISSFQLFCDVVVAAGPFDVAPELSRNAAPDPPVTASVWTDAGISGRNQNVTSEDSKRLF